MHFSEPSKHYTTEVSRLGEEQAACTPAEPVFRTHITKESDAPACAIRATLAGITQRL